MKKLKFDSNPSLKGNVFFNIVYQLVQIGIPILLIPILSTRLKTDGNGVYAFIHSIVMYFSYFALLGVNYYGTKTIAAKKEVGISEEKKAFLSIFIAKALTSFISIVGYCVFCAIYRANTLILITQSLFLLSNFIDITWFFMGSENFRSICLRNLIIKSSSLILIVLLVKTPNDVWIYSLILGFAEFMNQLFMWMLLFKKRYFVGLKTIKINKKDIWLSLKGMLVFFVPQLLIELYTILNTTVLGAVWSSSQNGFGEVGIFDYANKIVSVLTTITVSLGMVFLARISALNQQNKTDEIKRKIETSLYYALFISTPLVVGVICTGHSFINWFLDGDDWSKIGTLLFFLPLKATLVSISNTLGVQYLIPTGKMKKYIISVALAASVCIVSNLLLVKSLGSIGSAISILAAELTVSVVQILFVRKEINILQVFKRCWRVFVSAAIMAIYIAICYLFLYNGFVSTFSSFFASGKISLVFADLSIIISAALCYFASLFLLREQTTKIISNKVKMFSNRFAVPSLLIAIVTAIVVSFGFGRKYNISFQANYVIVKRNAGVAIFNDSRTIEKYDNLRDSENANLSLVFSDYNAFIEESKKEHTRGFNYHIVDNNIHSVFYSFTIEHCQSSGTIYSVNLKYALKKTQFIISNIDSIVLSFSVTNYQNPEKNSFITLTNENNRIDSYFSNSRRDFVYFDYENGTSFWQQNDFTYTSSPYYLDRCNVTIGLALIDQNKQGQKAVESFKDASLFQEIWII